MAIHTAQNTYNRIDLQRVARIGVMADLSSRYLTLALTVIGTVVITFLPASLNIHPTLAQGGWHLAGYSIVNDRALRVHDPQERCGVRQTW